MNNDPRYNKVNSVDVIQQYADLNGIHKDQAYNELKNYGILELAKTEVTDIGHGKKTTRVYELSKDAKKSLQSGKNINEYITEMLEKEKNDKYLKTLQIKDLEEKINVMNIEQRGFWNHQKERNVQLTLLAIISVIFSIIALIRTF